MRRRPLRAEVAVTAGIFAALTTYFTSLGWYGLSVDPSAYTGPILAVCVTVAVIGMALRAVGVARPLVVATQTLAVAEVLHLWWGGGKAALFLVPTSSSLTEVAATVARAVDDAQSWAAPVPEQATAFPPLMIVIGSALALLVDAIAVTYRRPALAGLPLLAAFTMPVAVTGGIRWDHFVLASLAFMLLICAEHLSTIGRWGRPLASVDSRRDGPGTPQLSAARMLARSRGSVVRVLAPAVLLALAGSWVVPDEAGFLGGGGAGGGGGKVTIKNPITDLRRDLVQGPDDPLVFVRTEDPDPSYLRISALDEFDGRTWRPSNRELPLSQRINGTLPEPVGLGDSVRQVRYRYELSAFEALDSQWLPLPFPAVAADAPGDWRFDQSTRDVTTVDGDLTTSDLDYEATGLRTSPTARQLLSAFAPPAGISRENTGLPFDDGEVPGWLADLVEEVTDGARSDFERAVALQRWFRDPVNFTYTTQREAGNGVDELRTFLTPGPGGRAGYCEQFASAMATMARILDIPARVAVGFLRPDAVGPGTWLFSAHDLHSWPELYFAGSGWVRFEPTPADQAATVPGYTAGQLPQLAPDEGPSATAEPSAGSAPAAPADTSTTESTQETAGQRSLWWLWPLAALVAVVLLLAPRALRARQRRRRSDVATGLDRAAVEAAWTEVRACVLDLGHSWDDRATLRSQQRQLRSLLARSPKASRAAGAGPPRPVDVVVSALEGLVRSVERARFSASPLRDQEMQAAWQRAEIVGEALRVRSDSGDQRRARWWPRSLRSSPTEARTPGVAAASSSQENVRV